MGKTPQKTGPQLQEELTLLLKQEGELNKAIKANTNEWNYLKDKQVPQLRSKLQAEQEELKTSRNLSLSLRENIEAQINSYRAKLEQAEELQDAYAGKLDNLMMKRSEVQERIDQIRANPTYKSYWAQEKQIEAIDAKADQMARAEEAREGITPANPIYKSRYKKLKSAFKKKLLNKLKSSPKK